LSGYAFGGWYTKVSGGIKIGEAGASYAPTADITLYARWILTRTVTYNATGGSVSPASATVNDGLSVTLPTPTWNRYLFNGWYTEVSGGIKIGDANVSYTPTATITLYAQWTFIAKVGSAGPAGGIIFYDKGEYSDGWRYLEAAPTNIKVDNYVAFEWGGDSLNSATAIGGTGTAVGDGKRNTELIVAKLNSLHITTRAAAMVCASLEVNGFDDWFLPSKDELNLMYTELKLRGSGSFATEFGALYWSSSEYYSPGSGNALGCTQNFYDGSQGILGKVKAHRVRACRRF
jgi:hypothetical protein